MLFDRHQVIEPESCVLLCLWHRVPSAASALPDEVSWPGQSNRHHVMRVAAQAARKKAYPDKKEGPAEAGPVGRLGSPAPEMEHAAVLI
jgi:hypothetical protein